MITEDKKIQCEDVIPNLLVVLLVDNRSVTLWVQQSYFQYPMLETISSAFRERQTDSEGYKKRRTSSVKVSLPIY